MNNLKIWQNESDVIIAESQADAEALLAELCGPECLEECGDWYCLEDDDTFTMAEEFEEAPYLRAKTQKAKDWVKQNGRCYLASDYY